VQRKRTTVSFLVTNYRKLRVTRAAEAATVCRRRVIAVVSAVEPPMRRPAHGVWLPQSPKRGEGWVDLFLLSTGKPRPPRSRFQRLKHKKSSRDSDAVGFSPLNQGSQPGSPSQQCIGMCSFLCCPRKQEGEGNPSFPEQTPSVLQLKPGLPVCPFVQSPDPTG
jgi:hypothetical protein